MKLIDLIDNIHSGMIIRWQFNGTGKRQTPYLCRPEERIEKLSYALVMKAVLEKGWLRRCDDGSYEVTELGKQQL